MSEADRTYAVDVLDDDLLLPEQKRATFPESCPLGKLYRKRVAQNRDLTVIVSDWNLERGSGKTTLALRLAQAADRTAEGITPEKATISAESLSEAYTSKPEGSALLLDEAEAGISNRRAMSGVNEAMRTIVGMGRVEQKYLFLTTPGVHQIDSDIRAMADAWILVREVGRAQMYRVRFNPFEGKALTDNWGVLRWPDARPAGAEHTYQELTKAKRRALRGEGDESAGYVDADEAAQTAEEAAQTAERQKRDELLRTIYQQNDDMTQQKLADSVGLSRSRVADILSGE